jgi:hypothetical protein
MKENLAEHLFWLRSESRKENDPLLSLAKENLDRIKKGLKLKLTPFDNDGDLVERPPLNIVSRPVQPKNVIERINPPIEILPISPPTFEIPDSFFSDDDFEALQQRRRVSVNDTTGKSPWKVNNMTIQREAPLTEHMQPKLDAHKSNNFMQSPPAYMLSGRMEGLTPQASRSELMAEKGRISMEICDLMELLEDGGSRNPQLEIQLAELKKRR